MGRKRGRFQARLFTGRRISRWRFDGLTDAMQRRCAESGLQEFSQTQEVTARVGGQGMGSYHRHMPERAGMRDRVRVIRVGTGTLIHGRMEAMSKPWQYEDSMCV